MNFISSGIYQVVHCWEKQFRVTIVTLFTNRAPWKAQSRYVPASEVDLALKAFEARALPYLTNFSSYSQMQIGHLNL